MASYNKEIRKATLYDVKDICRIHALGGSRPIRELFHKHMNTFVKIQGKQHAEIRDIYPFDNFSCRDYKY
ncbi:hypothetical protein DESME_02335 [Desulfitobacterium metallireducens DSM 15288]|uniref:Uncharacterized protein n=1 Tax=Desulfitobacterium metallireducens DSM 15288 TaxID=871968 RepID=W0EFX7_9FIRM|nr:hypothetical protein DESME_02335 [Desulfitobacterium metallireducens DSM 15288]